MQSRRRFLEWPLRPASASLTGGRPRSIVRRAGISLIELLVAVTLMGILVAMAAPSFRRAVDQARADIAAANLRALWSAERCYWLEYRSYTDDLNQLTELGLLDPSISAASGQYVYAIPEASTNEFTATASRVGGTRWSGQFEIDQTGIVSGSIDTFGEPSLVPGFQ